MKFFVKLFILFICFGSFSFASETINIRSSLHNGFYRIVFDMNKKIPVEKIEFEEPPLLVLKFKSNKPIRVKKFLQNNKYIKDFEIIRSKEDVKVVIELKNRYRYSLFSLKKPYRLVLDIKQKVKPKRENDLDDPIKDIIIAALEKEERKSSFEDPIAQIIKNHEKKEQAFDLTFAYAPLKWKGKKKIIVIDPGHGGRDPGAVANGLREKDINLIFARQLKKILEKDPRFKVYLTRNSDRYISLYKRTIYAIKKNADLFISLHCNSSPSGYGYGTYVYTLNLRGAKSKLARLVEKRENRAVLEYVRVSANRSVNKILADLAMSTTMTEGLNFAKLLRKNLSKVNRFQDIDSANFAVLKTPGIPSVLIEIAYITHKREARLLKSPVFVKRFSYQVYKSIVEYFFPNDKHLLVIK